LSTPPTKIIRKQQIAKFLYLNKRRFMMGFLARHSPQRSAHG
jgi:hypothetical protein